MCVCGGLQLNSIRTTESQLVLDRTAPGVPTRYVSPLRICAYVSIHATVFALTRMLGDSAELGLPAEAFVFCNFNHNYKIDPAIFDAWARILQSVPHSVLWLLQYPPAAEKHLREEARARGLSDDRYAARGWSDRDRPHASRLSLRVGWCFRHCIRKPTAASISRGRCNAICSWYDARHSLRYTQAHALMGGIVGMRAGMGQDTPLYNAHTTASDALWAGIPLLTIPGKVMAARVATSILHAADGLDDVLAVRLPGWTPEQAR